jgi:acyl transferase domain-containing protein/thioesterase domain-containing protein/SAM-dependent methyltransferase/acyl carrier protein
MSREDVLEGTGGIAIIGMAGRFPGARDIAALWKRLREGEESITRLTDARLAAAGVDEAQRRNPAYVPARGLLEDVDLFDAAFFGYSPREAEFIDPQQRLFLESAWAALEDAGYDPERFPGPIGLYAGAGAPGYLLHHVAPTMDTRELLDSLGVVMGNDKDHLTTRVAYKLDLRGPVITVGTACSTSLVAVQLACQSLLDFQCDMALAGGVSVAFPVGTGYLPQEGNILSPDGHCRAFDVQAQGTVPADGVGLVVLKRLEDALAAGDSIRAVILGAAVNNDGSHKVGYTAPGIEGQVGVIRAALALAGADPRSISYVEAHGTGTALGDAIEVAALTQAFRRSTQERGFCALGSLKTNLGHLNTAAGVGGLIKATLALENKLLPPTLHFTQPHPKLALESSPFFVNTTALEWKAGATPRRAGVSSFAMGGTNAHVILEEAPPRESTTRTRPWELLVLSARTEPALDASTARLREHLEAHPSLPLADVAYTLQAGRKAFAHRRAVVCRDAADAVRALAEPSRQHTGSAPRMGREVAFLLPGQGAQHEGMAEALYREEPVFREEVDRCARLLEPHLGLDLRGLLYPREPGTDSARLEQTAFTQPALFTVEYALARLWMSRGVIPAAMLGHSLGEYVAACLAGVFSLEDALALVAARGRLMQGLAPGAMLAVPLAEAEVRAGLPPELSLAAINGPASCVIAGPLAAVEEFEARLSRRGVSARRLRTSHAFHSAMVEPILSAFAAEVRRVRRNTPRVPYLSNVTGTWVTEAEATDPDYWVRHLRQSVRFAEGLAELSTRGHVLLEVGPGQVLGALARSGDSLSRVLPSLRASREDERGDLRIWLTSLGQLWAEGVPLDWAAHHKGRRGLRVPLPAYPFEGRRHWLERPLVDSGTASTEPRPLDALEEELRQALGIRPVASYPGLKQGLEALCSSAVCEYLRGAGVEPRRGAVYTRQQLRHMLGLQPRFERLFDVALAGLASDGIVRVSGEQVTFLCEGAEVEPAHGVRQRLVAEHPGFLGLIEFVDHCLRHHRPALRGEVAAIGVLYPNGSSEFIQTCKARTVEHTQERIYNQLLKEAVTRLVTSARGQRLRILEVGGGQGLLTWPLVEALAGRDVEYHFTDLGKVFVEDARREAARRGLGGMMTFGVLDASREPAEQGYPDRGFDLIVAYNVVHATPHVPRTLEYLQRLLVPGGTLGLVETVRVERWEALSWGLAEGWWYYDDDLREGSPLLPLDGWEKALAATGFEHVEAWPRMAERAQADHGLVLARRRPGAAGRVRPPVPKERPERSAGASAHRAPRPALHTGYVAPRSELERRIAALCEELLGISGIGIHDDFFELGGDSLVMLRLTDRLRRELGQEIPPGAAFRGSTVERMALALQRLPDPRTVSPAIPIQPLGTKPPLFFIHPASGVVFPFFELARELGPDQPFYGLQALGLDGEREPDERIEDMARSYVAAIRAVQPVGPYFIGGHSFGCLVAFEVAQQLTTAGQEIGLLALVDEPAPLPGHRPSHAQLVKFFVTGMARSFWPHLHDYLYLVGAEREGRAERPTSGLRAKLGLDRRALEAFLARSALANFVPADARLLVLRQPAMLPMFRLFLIHVRETYGYEPRAYARPITLFTTGEVRGMRGGGERTMGWAKLAAGGVEVHELPGDHLSVLKPPHVQVLAARLAECLARARPR